MIDWSTLLADFHLIDQMVAIIWKLNHHTHIFISQSSKFDFAKTLFLFPSSMYSLFLYFFVSFISFCFIPFHGAKTRLLLIEFWSSHSKWRFTCNVGQKFLESSFFHSFPLWESCITSSECSCNRYYSLWPFMAAPNNKNKTLFFKLGKLVIYYLALQQIFNWSVIIVIFFPVLPSFWSTRGSTPLMDVVKGN